MPRVPDLPCAGTCGKLLWRSTTSLPEGQAMCRECRRNAPLVHGTSRAYATSCRCDDCKAWKAKTHLAYNRRREAGVYVVKQCIGEDCERPAMASRGMCRMHYRRWERENGRVKDAWNDRTRANWRRRKALKRGAPRAEVIYHTAIFERDRWVCGICLEQVDRTLEWPHPQSASLDHRVAIANGGTHTRDNVQCSHLRCNIAKGKKHTETGLRHGHTEEQRTP